MKYLLEQLITPVSPSGCERNVAAVLTKLAAPYGEVSLDNLGNLTVYKKGTGKRILLAAHMDTVGFIVTQVDERGFVRFGMLGGVKPINAVGQRVRFENGVIGVVSYERGTEPKDLTADSLYIDTAGESVRVGDVAVFDGAPYFTGNKVISPYLDNRLGCAVCLKALELMQNTDNEIFCTFTVQEEVGCRGAKPAAYTICPDLAIAVDICGVPDTPGGDAPNCVTVEGGPVVKIMDRRTISHRTVCDLLETAAAEQGIAVQRYVTKHGGTDAGTIFDTRGGVPTGNLAIPIRYTHCPNEIADMDVALQCAKLLAAAIVK